jgi:hypothetical protein
MMVELSRSIFGRFVGGSACVSAGEGWCWRDRLNSGRYRADLQERRQRRLQANAKLAPAHDCQSSLTRDLERILRSTEVKSSGNSRNKNVSSSTRLQLVCRAHQRRQRHDLPDKENAV